MSTGSGSESGAVARATQTDDDWSEIKADIKKLVEAVQPLIPQPKPAETERVFKCDVDRCVDEIRPTPKKLEFYVDLLLWMFLGYWDGNPALPTGVPLTVSLGQLPNFAEHLTLCFPGKKDPVSMRARLAFKYRYAPHREYTTCRGYAMSRRAEVWQNYNDSQPVNETTLSWVWDRPWETLSDEGFIIYTSSRHYNSTRLSPWKYR
ncbi:hypothetical protein F4801DRAFT_301074 [Xylaria longipes]|nr:hypothetical protein F4801DRAFT_301074 [Xylaria longipes]